MPKAPVHEDRHSVFAKRQVRLTWKAGAVKAISTKSFRPEQLAQPEFEARISSPNTPHDLRPFFLRERFRHGQLPRSCSKY